MGELSHDSLAFINFSYKTYQEKALTSEMNTSKGFSYFHVIYIVITCGTLSD